MITEFTLVHYTELILINHCPFSLDVIMLSISVFIETQVERNNYFSSAIWTFLSYFPINNIPLDSRQLMGIVHKTGILLVIGVSYGRPHELFTKLHSTKNIWVSSVSLYLVAGCKLLTTHLLDSKLIPRI